MLGFSRYLRPMGGAGWIFGARSNSTYRKIWSVLWRFARREHISIYRPMVTLGRVFCTIIAGEPICLIGISSANCNAKHSKGTVTSSFKICARFVYNQSHALVVKDKPAMKLIQAQKTMDTLDIKNNEDNQCSGLNSKGTVTVRTKLICLWVEYDR